MSTSVFVPEAVYRCMFTSSLIPRKAVGAVAPEVACLPVHLQHFSSFHTGDEGPEPKATRVLHGALVMTNNVSTACVRVPSQSVGTLVYS